MARRCVVGQHMLRFEVKHTDIVLTVKDNDFVGAELDVSYGSSAWRLEGHADSFLTEDIDDTRSELGLVGADGE